MRIGGASPAHKANEPLLQFALAEEQEHEEDGNDGPGGQWTGERSQQCSDDAQRISDVVGDRDGHRATRASSLTDLFLWLRDLFGQRAHRAGNPVEETAAPKLFLQVVQLVGDRGLVSWQFGGDLQQLGTGQVGKKPQSKAARTGRSG